MMAPDTCARCDEKAVVGLGPGPVWFCIEHFAEELGGILDVVRTLAEPATQDFAGEAPSDG